jgi:hypothetical protein
MDDDEAVAVAVGLRAAATSTLSGVEESPASARATGTAPWDIETRFLLYAATLAIRIPPGAGVVEPETDDTCILRIAANEIAPLVDYAIRIPYDFAVLGPDAVREALKPKPPARSRNHVRWPGGNRAAQGSCEWGSAALCDGWRG